jgi:hypothetical protein
VCTPPPPLVPGGHTRLPERGWESPNTDEGTDTVVLCLYMYLVITSNKARAQRSRSGVAAMGAEAVDMNGRFQMQGGKNWFFPKEMNANRFFWDSHWLEIWSNHYYPSMRPNGGSVAMDSEATGAKAIRFGRSSKGVPNGHR